MREDPEIDCQKNQWSINFRIPHGTLDQERLNWESQSESSFESSDGHILAGRKFSDQFGGASAPATHVFIPTGQRDAYCHTH